MAAAGLVEQIPNGVFDDLGSARRVRQPLAIRVQEVQEVRGQLEGYGHSLLHGRVYTWVLTYAQVTKM